MKIAAYQLTPALDVQSRKDQLCKILAEAQSNHIDFLCLPEGLLTGCYAQSELARASALHVGDALFAEWLEMCKEIDTTVIVGFNRVSYEYQ